MIWEAFSSAEDDKCIDIRNFKIMIAAGVATSIDALAVGVTLAVIDIPVARIFVTAMAFPDNCYRFCHRIEVGKEDWNKGREKVRNIGRDNPCNYWCENIG